MAIRSVLVAVDLGPHTEAVLDVGIELASLGGATLHLLHAAAGEPAFVGYGRTGMVHTRDERAGELHGEHADLQALADRAEGRGVACRALLVMGPTQDVILRVAGEVEADLIVLGGRRHGVVHDLLVGNTADAIVRAARVPVVLVPIREE